MSAAWVRVAVPLPVDELFTYAVPKALQDTIRPGHAVLVPFGARRLTGWVIETCVEPDIPTDRIREIEKMLDPFPVVDALQMGLLQWASKYYLASLGEMLGTALPAAIRTRTCRVLLPTPSAAEALATGTVPEPRATVLREIIRHNGITPRALARLLEPELTGATVASGIRALKHSGLVKETLREQGAGQDRVRVVRLLIDPDKLLAVLPRAGTRMREVVAAIAKAGGSIEIPTLQDMVGQNAASSIVRLEKANIVSVENREKADPVRVQMLEGAESCPLKPTPAQAAAIEAIGGQEGFGVFLLHGVTGSGKTEVYLQVASRVLARGRQVLVLVPEIGLTPQLLGRFVRRRGESVAVLHSGRTEIERLREWRRVRAGQARVVVGARSALFAPFSRLGLIVVDEEHDDSYKQEDRVRYHARDLAVVRAQHAGCPVVLGSATPSLESLLNVKLGRYRLLELKERATAKPVPRVEVVDMNREEKDASGTTPVLSARLKEVLTAALDAGGKAILLYNRRGYATVVQCTRCGSGFTCPSCRISLVLHLARRKLICHYCGLKRQMPDHCPVCGGDLEMLGKGTERVEEAIAKAFPSFQVGRMDADTTTGRGAHQRILDDFRRGAYQLLVGTQIVAKGHDFPDVAVAAVLGLDHLLTMPDFRAAERTFALVTQLAGRAGRGDAPGQVILQTHHPDHFVFKLLGNPEQFAENELRIRKILGYPPWTRLVMIRLESTNAALCKKTATDLAEKLRSSAPPGGVLDVLGPAPAPLALLVGRHRYQVVLRGRQPGPFRTWLDEHRKMLLSGVPHGVRLSVDVDPRSLM